MATGLPGIPLPPNPPVGVQPRSTVNPTQLKLGLTQRAALQTEGSLIIVDRFSPSPTPFGGSALEVPHGALVQQSAMDTGFRGNLVTSPSDVSFTPQPLERRKYELLMALAEPGLSPQQTRELLAEQAEVGHRTLLHKNTERLEGLTEAGVRHSAVNFSQGASKASAVESAFNSAISGRESENITRAMGVDPDKIFHKDPKVSVPERLRLQQGLTDLISKRIDESTSLKESRAKYQRAVQNFEKNHNSVVVSAGNEGGVADQFAEIAEGQRIRLPVGWQSNVLVTPEVTSVGALKGQQVSSYSNRDPEVDLYADGDVAQQGQQQPAEGTSFAAPRVAAGMAALHRQYPQLSSAQVEAKLKSQLGHNIAGPDGSPVTSLNMEKTRAYLQSQVF